MIATGVADASYVRTSAPKSLSGFGSNQQLSTCRQARMTVQFLHNGAPSASLAVCMNLVLNETMRCPILLGWDSWMRFHSRSYQTLPPTQTGVSSVNPPSLTFAATATAVLPPIPAIATISKSPTAQFTRGRTCP